MESNKMNNGIYIYGVIADDEKLDLDSIGSGEFSGDIYAIAWQDLNAVVRKSPLKVYGSMMKNDVVKDLFYHQSVVEKIMKFHTIIPMKFGTFLNTEEEVFRFLKIGYQQFKEALRLMKNKIELDVVALWDNGAAFKEIAEESHIKELKNRLAGDQAGSQLSERIKLGRMVEESLKKKNLEYSEKILSALKQEALKICSHDTLDNTMIINSSFLLDKNREEDFDKRLHDLDELYNKRVNFRCVGPLPPYSFSSIEVKHFNFTEIDAARKLLGLSDEISAPKIKSAHRKLAFKYHPDKITQGGHLNKEFDEVTRAYKLLLEYYQSGQSSLRKEEVEGSILINISKMTDETLGNNS